MASSPSSPGSPTGTLTRESSKKDTGKLGWVGTLTRRKKGQEVNELETEGRLAIESPTTPITVAPDTFDLDENDKRSMVEPASLENPKVKELQEVLLDWINDELSDLRIVLRNITEDLYDGLILAILMEKLAEIKLAEFTQSVESQKAKLSVLLEHVNKLLGIPQQQAKWTANTIHNKDIVAILHLLVALARHFECPRKLPGGVTINMVVVQKKGGILLPMKVVEEITAANEGEEAQNGKPERDAFDALFDNAPEKLNVVKKDEVAGSGSSEGRRARFVLGREKDPNDNFEKETIAKETVSGQLREMTQRLKNVREQLREKDGQLRERTEQLTDVQGQLQERDGQLNERTQQLTIVRGQLQEKNEEVTSLKERLRARDQEVNELETSLSTAQQTLQERSRQETPDWVISRDQIQLTEKCLGSGGWGKVVEGKYCGCTVAIKQTYEVLLKSSPYYRELFEREMNIASRCRHPCLLQFIGATNDEESPLFVTELMETSLRKLVEERPLSRSETSVISLDVARALNYLHLKKPRPIIHRDISSANVLLWRQNDQWRGKVSDYGAANFTKATMTACPGAEIYSAPEAFTEHQNLKVDVYSFGVLLCEMCTGILPDRDRREEHVAMVTDRVFRTLIRRCLQRDPEARPSMEEIISELEKPV